MSHASTTTPMLITFPDQGFTPVYTFANTATRTLDMTMYELVDTTFEQDLIALAKKGVTVRVILDQNLEKASNTAAFNTLTAAGITVHWANPVFHATHQKTITVDGHSSLILTANLASRFYSTTRDFAILNTNPADIAEIERVFNADLTNSSVTPAAATDLIWSPNLARPDLVALIQSAKHSLLVENEEMGDSVIVNALAARAKAGVAVTVIMTNTANTYAAEFDTLTQAGVKVYTYPNTTTGFYVHAKVIVADSAVAYVGSINFTTASETSNRELGQTTHDATVITSLSKTLTADAAGGTLWTTAAAAAHQLSRIPNLSNTPRP